MRDEELTRIPWKKRTARRRPESREETPKEGIRRRSVARLEYGAQHQMQWAKAPTNSKSAVAETICDGVPFLHHADEA